MNFNIAIESHSAKYLSIRIWLVFFLSKLDILLFLKNFLYPGFGHQHFLWESDETKRREYTRGRNADAMQIVKATPCRWPECGLWRQSVARRREMKGKRGCGVTRGTLARFRWSRNSSLPVCSRGSVRVGWRYLSRRETLINRSFPVFPKLRSVCGTRYSPTRTSGITLRLKRLLMILHFVTENKATLCLWIDDPRVQQDDHHRAVIAPRVSVDGFTVTVNFIATAKAVPDSRNTLESSTRIRFSPYIRR